MKYNIEKGVPIQGNRTSEMRQFILTLKPGESFLFPKADHKKISSAANLFKKVVKISGFDYTIRSVGDKQYRFWRK